MKLEYNFYFGKSRECAYFCVILANEGEEIDPPIECEHSISTRTFLNNYDVEKKKKVLSQQSPQYENESKRI